KENGRAEAHPFGDWHEGADQREWFEPMPVGTGRLSTTGGAARARIGVTVEPLTHHDVIRKHGSVDAGSIGASDEVRDVTPVPGVDGEVSGLDRKVGERGAWSAHGRDGRGDGRSPADLGCRRGARGVRAGFIP